MLSNHAIHVADWVYASQKAEALRLIIESPAYDNMPDEERALISAKHSVVVAYGNICFLLGELAKANEEKP